MKDGEEFVYEFADDRGSGYIGNRRVKNATAVLTQLIQAMAVRRVQVGGTEVEYYRIAPGTSATAPPTAPAPPDPERDRQG